MSTNWYQKPTDTGLIFSFRALVPNGYKRDMIQGCIHLINNATSTWSNFRTCIQKAKKIWEANQFSPQFYEPIVSETIDKLLGPKINVTYRQKKDKGLSTIFTLQYRGTVSDKFRRRLNNITRAPVIFTTRKLKTAFPSLKSKIPSHLCSNVVNHITLLGCSASFVGQTTRHLTTRLNEHSLISTPVGEHMTQSVGITQNLVAKIIDRSNDPSNF